MVHMMGRQRSPTATSDDHQSLVQKIGLRMSSPEIIGALWQLEEVWTPDVGTQD